MHGNGPESSYGIVTPRLFGQNSQLLGRIVFTHAIDSHNNFNISNPCPFIPLPNGDELETGTMSRPDKPGAPMTDYEEVWRYLPCRRGPGHGVSWILESDDGGLGVGQFKVSKVFMGRIGATFLVLHQSQVHVRSLGLDGQWVVTMSGDVVSARLEEWSDGHWEVKYSLGPDRCDLPSMTDGIDKDCVGMWYPGKKVNVAGHPYIVRAFEEFAQNKASL